MDIRTLALQSNTNETSLMAVYAGTDQEKWKQLRKYHFLHQTFGKGLIKEFEPSEDGNLFIHVDFEIPFEGKSERLFLNSAFEQGFFSLVEPIEKSNELIEFLEEMHKLIKHEKEEIQKEELAKKAEEERQKKIQEQQRIHLEEAIKQREREEADRAFFLKLKEKYLVSACQDTSPTSPLFMNLLKLENEEILSKDDLSWLEEKGFNAPLAFYYEKKSHYSNCEEWDVVHAGKYWREAGFPQRAIDVTDSISSTNVTLNSAILVNRGGAYRDLKNLTAAEECGKKSLKLTPNSFYPYNLLGAVFYQNGDPEEGEKHFDKARQLGASPRATDAQIRNSVKLAEKEQQVIVAQYLLKKDPIKYKWAKYYLQIEDLLPNHANP